MEADPPRTFESLNDSSLFIVASFLDPPQVCALICTSKACTVLSEYWREYATALSGPDTPWLAVTLHRWLRMRCWKATTKLVAYFRTFSGVDRLRGGGRVPPPAAPTHAAACEFILREVDDVSTRLQGATSTGAASLPSLVECAVMPRVALSLLLFSVGVLREVPKLRAPRGAADYSDVVARTRARVTRELPSLVWLAGDTIMKALRGVAGGAWSMAPMAHRALGFLPVMAQVLPAVVTAALELLPTTRPHTYDPVRRLGLIVLGSVLRLPEQCSAPSTDATAACVPVVPPEVTGLGAAGSRTPTVHTLPSSGSTPTFLGMHAAAAAVTILQRRACEQIWRRFEADLGVGHLALEGSGDEEASLAALWIATQAGMAALPPEVADARVLGVSAALRRVRFTHRATGPSEPSADGVVDPRPRHLDRDDELEEQQDEEEEEAVGELGRGPARYGVVVMGRRNPPRPPAEMMGPWEAEEAAPLGGDDVDDDGEDAALAAARRLASREDGSLTMAGVLAANGVVMREERHDAHLPHHQFGPAQQPPFVLSDDGDGRIDNFGVGIEFTVAVMEGQTFPFHMAMNLANPRSGRAAGGGGGACPQDGGQAGSGLVGLRAPLARHS